MILDAERVAALMDQSVSDPRSYLLAFYPEHAPNMAPLGHVNRDARPMVARVNHGQWIVSCECGASGVPAPGMLLWLSIPLAWCIRCANAAAGGGWRRVELPSNDQRGELEAVLLCRPNQADRNWTPGETLAVLIRENREHGDPIPEGM